MIYFLECGPYEGPKCGGCFGVYDSLRVEAAKKAQDVRGGGGGDALKQLNAEELESLLQEIVEPECWKNEGVYIRGLKGRLIVRQTPRVHRQIHRMMIRLGVLPEPIYASHRGGCILRSVVPVVGQEEAP